MGTSIADIIHSTLPTWAIIVLVLGITFLRYSPGIIKALSDAKLKHRKYDDQRAATARKIHNSVAKRVENDDEHTQQLRALPRRKRDETSHRGEPD